MEIPLKCLITVEMGQDTSIGHKIMNSHIDLDAPKHIYLMLFMILDSKDPKSFFKPYYDILPPTLHNMPIFWNSDELALLEGSYILTQIEERNIAIETDYTAICQIAPEFEDLCTLHEFKWARMCVCSRNFGLVVNGIRTAALVPYADMLNHYRPRETKWQYDNILQGFTIVSMGPISSGLQIYDSYGQKCNHRFLLNYGFSVENNVEPDGYCPNEVPIVLQLHQDDPLYEFKCSYFRREGSYLPTKRIRVSICENENFYLLLSMLRIIESDQSDMNVLTGNNQCNSMNRHTSYDDDSCYSRGGRSVRDAQNPVNVDNELRSMRLLLSICKSYLSIYPTSYDDDVKRLSNTKSSSSSTSKISSIDNEGVDLELTPFSNHRNAIIQIKGEKEILLYYANLAEISIDLLSMNVTTNSGKEDFYHIIDRHINDTTTRTRSNYSAVEHADTDEKSNGNHEFINGVYNNIIITNYIKNIIIKLKSQEFEMKALDSGDAVRYA